MLVVHYTMIVIFFFNDTATTDIYTYRHTLSLHDALPILLLLKLQRPAAQAQMLPPDGDGAGRDDDDLPPLGPAAGQIVGERTEPRPAHAARLLVDETGGADLDDEAPGKIGRASCRERGCQEG